MQATPSSGKIILTIVSLVLLSCGSKEDQKSPPPEVTNRPVSPADQNPAGQAPSLPINPSGPVEPNPGDPTTPSVPTPVPVDVPPSGFTTWLELDSANPELKSVAIFEGADPALALLGLNPECKLYYLGEGTDKGGQAVLVFRTSYNHNGDTHPYLILPKTNLRAPGVVLKRTDGLAEMFLKLRADGDLNSIYAFNLKWFHTNHYDTGTCDSLQRAQS